MKLWNRAWMRGGLVLAGLALWLTVGRGWRDWNAQAPVLVFGLILASLALVKPIRRVVLALGEAVRSPSPRARRVTAVVVALASAAYLLFTAIHQHRAMIPVWHDEYGFLLQMRMLSHGILWMPRHPLGDFFDSFYIITDRAYTALAFPGTAMMFMPELWLHLPLWALPVLAAGAVVGLLYRVTAELMDGVAGLLAAAMLVSLSIFRTMSVMLMGQVPILLLGLAGVWAFLHWRRGNWKGVWSVVIGVCAGWAAITRPVDALAWFVPIGLAMVWDIWGQHGREWRSLAWVALGAMPLLSVQLVMNHGVTGSMWQSPWEYYQKRDFPGLRWGLGGEKAGTVVSTLSQKRRVYAQYIGPSVEEHRPGNWLKQWLGAKGEVVCQGVVPQGVFLVLLPMGLPELTRRGWPLVAALPVFVGLYVFFPLMLWHYPVVVAPAAIVLSLMGLRALQRNWPRWQQSVSAGVTLGVLGVGLVSLPEFGPQVHDEFFAATPLIDVNAALASLPREPAVVLFRDEGDAAKMEAVYNTDTAWPDDALIIRAQDLGKRNVEAFRYYAQHEPMRVFYLYNGREGRLQRLGTARELAE